MNWVLVTGSADEDSKRILFQKLFHADETTIDLNKNGYLISDYSNLSSISFDLNTFKLKCEQLKSSLKAIICIENLNPRPETLLNDFKVLVNVFTTEELRNHLHLFITFSSKHVDSKELQKKEITNSSEITQVEIDKANGDIYLRDTYNSCRIIVLK